MTDRDAGYREGIEAATVHDLKIWPEYFEEVISGRKPFEIRKNDRNYRKGDILLLREWVPETHKYTGREARYIVTYMMGNGIWTNHDFVVMGIRALPLPSTPDDGKAEPVAGEDVDALMAQLREKSNWRKDVHADLHRKAADVIGALMKGHRSSPAGDGAIREALERLEASEPRAKDDIVLSFAVGCAIDAMKSVLSAHAGDAAKSSGGEPKFGCKRAGGFVDSNCMAMCDCHKTMIKPSPPDTHAEVKG